MYLKQNPYIYHLLTNRGGTKEAAILKLHFKCYYIPFEILWFSHNSKNGTKQQCELWQLKPSTLKTVSWSSNNIYACWWVMLHKNSFYFDVAINALSNLPPTQHPLSAVSAVCRRNRFSFLKTSYQPTDSTQQCNKWAQLNRTIFLKTAVQKQSINQLKTIQNLGKINKYISSTKWFCWWILVFSILVHA